MISVGRSSKHGMPPTKVAAGSVVQWDIRAQEHDIGLHIIFVPEGATQSSPDVVLVQEFVRVKNETNAFRAPCAGTLLVTLDNTYSMLRGKHVAFAMTAFAADDPAAAAIPTALNFSSVASTNEAATVGVRMFFSNDFDGAERFFARQRNRLPVFALGHATLAFLRAMMTMAEADMALATTRLEHALKLSQRIMPESKWFGSAAPMTNVQLDASVVHAECKLLMSALLLLTDQGKFTGLIKSALLFRGAWKLYESCDAVLGHTVTSISGGDGSFGMRAGAARELGAVEDAVLGEDSMLEGTPVIPTDDEDADMVLASSAAAAAGAPVHAPATTVSARAEGVSPALEGILFGIGSFNLLLSILPPLILKLVSAFGFPHSRFVCSHPLLLLFVPCCCYCDR